MHEGIYGFASPFTFNICCLVQFIIYFYIFLVVSPEEPGTSVSITIEEMDALLYRPQEGEWGDSDQHTQCERIICGIDQLFNMG